MKPKLFVILVTHNGMRWLDKCVGSIFASDYPAELIVVDNYSTDGSADFVEHTFPAARVIRNSCNEGFGRANNRAIRLAMDEGADYFYLINQDAWVEPDVFGRLVEIMERNPEYGITGPVQLSADREHINENFLRWLGNKTAPGFIDDLYFGRVGELQQVDLFPADNWLVRRKAWEQTGGFSPLFWFYGEDSEMVCRMAYHGWKMGVAPACKAVHDIAERGTTDERELFMEYLLYVIDINDIRRPFGQRAFFGWLKMALNLHRMRGSRSRKLYYDLKALRMIGPSRRNRRLTVRGGCFL